MTTYFPFTPNILVPYQFAPVLDGQLCTATVPWCLFGKRYYVTLASQGGGWLFTVPLIGSRAARAIQGLEWKNGAVIVTITEGHRYRIGSNMILTIKGAQPDGYNGIQRAFIINQTQFIYPLSNDPGMATLFGQVTQDINIAGGYVQNSLLVYRPSTQNFEVDP